MASLTAISAFEGTILASMSQCWSPASTVRSRGCTLVAAENPHCSIHLPKASTRLSWRGLRSWLWAFISATYAAELLGRKMGGLGLRGLLIPFAAAVVLIRPGSVAR